MNSGALAVCYERGDRLYAIYSRDRDHPPVRAANDAFFRTLAELAEVALGPGLRTRRNVTMVLSLTGWQSFQALRAGGMDTEAAGAAMAEVLVGWLGARSRRSR